jgi:hypothetical protein
MAKILLYIVIFIGLLTSSGCSENSYEKEITFIKSDTLTIQSDKHSYQNSKFKLSNNRKHLLISQSRELLILNLEKEEVIRQINFDRLDLVLPQDLLYSFTFDEESNSYSLFFPHRKKVILLDSNLHISKEIFLNGLDSVNHRIFPYNDSFFISLKDKIIVVGTKYNTNEFSSPEYFKKSRLISVFNFDGKLLSQFGEFPEVRKQNVFSVSSQGTNCLDVDLDNQKIYTKISVGVPDLEVFNYEGEMIENGGLKSDKIDYTLYPTNGPNHVPGKYSDSHTEIKWINENLVAVKAFQFRDQEIPRYTDLNVVLIEDLANQKLYSKVIEPYHKLVYADEKELRFIRTHPNRDELIMVRVEYVLE